MQKPTLPEEFLEELAEHNPIGMSVDSDDVRSWFDMVWLRFSTYKYTERGMRRAIISWWSRVREHEILAARDRLTRLRSDAENERLDAYAQAMTVEPPQPPTNWSARLH